jgi:hypothetical protein
MTDGAGLTLQVGGQLLDLFGDEVGTLVVDRNQ